MSTYSLTVIRACGRKRLTKIYEPDGSIRGYDRVSRVHSVESRKCKTLESLLALLEELDDEPQKCVIRGELRDDAAEPLLRRKSHFSDDPRSWVMIDIDQLKTPEPRNMRERAEYARAALPAEFHGVRCVYQASASAQRMSRRVKVHLWFLLERPATSAGLRAWLSDRPAIDPSVFRSVQPHYTAAPINGPTFARLGLLDGPIERVATPVDVDLEPVELLSTISIEPRVAGLRDLTPKQQKRCEARANAQVEKLIAECTIAYRDAYTAGCVLGHAVAWSTWNKEDAHTLINNDPDVDQLVWDVGSRFAAIKGAKHDATVYAARVREGLVWAFARAREELTRNQVNDARRAEQMEAAARRAAEQLKRSIKVVRDDPQALADEAEKLGRFTAADVLDREKTIKQLRIESGSSADDVAAALERGELDPIDLDAWRAGLKVSGRYGEVISGNEYNCTMILKQHHELQNAFRWNDRALCFEVVRDTPWSFGADVPRRLDPSEIGHIVVWLGTLGCRDASSKTVHAALENLVGQVPHFDPFLEALGVSDLSAKEARRELRRMGPSKLDTWLIDHFDAAGDPEYLAAVGRKTLIAAVARGFEPGAQVDTVLVLSGSQGFRKTSACRALGSIIDGGFRTLGSINTKDDLMLLQGPVLLEIGELRAFASAAEETGKSWLTICTDSFRAPYARTIAEHPRRCVFIGTTDKDQYLTDHDNRRFWPVRCRQRSRMKKKQARELWREAALRYIAGEQWWLSEDEIALQRKEAARARTGDIWEDTLAEALADVDKITTREAIKKCLPDSKYTVGEQHRASRILRALGFKSTQSFGGGRYWKRFGA